MSSKNIFSDFNGFNYSPAIPYEEGVTRRDPSPVIKYNDNYFVWYSRTTRTTHGYTATIWYAISDDGNTWIEQGQALATGNKGTFDEHAVFTPSILKADNCFYLFYTAVPEPFNNDNGGPGGTKTAIGVAISRFPDGPWKRIDKNPVLTPAVDESLFDSHRVDDSCLLVRDGKYWLYYKGRQLGKTPAETKMGVAIAENPEGPYTKYRGNPILDSGHEVCVWPYSKGVGAIVAPAGPQGSTLQYSEDGINFKRVRDLEVPRAPGPYREDNFQDCSNGTGPGISWGLSHKIIEDGEYLKWPYLIKFKCNLKANS